MSAWVTIPCLLTLRDEFNAVAPKRDKGSDGTIGDAAHTSSSDHTPDEDSDVLRSKDADHINEVHALDIDSTGPWPAGVTFDKMMQYLITECRKSGTSGKDRGRLRYIIWNGYIYEADNSWAKRKYTGSDQHTGHGHFSAEYDTSFENDTSPWGIKETFGGGVSKQEVLDGLAEYYKVGTQADGKSKMNKGGIQVWDDHGIPLPLLGPAEKGPAWRAFDELQQDAIAKNEAIDTMAQTIEGQSVKIDALTTKVDALTTLIESHIAGLLEQSNTVKNI